ncbi:MAG: hypothetical protein HY728_06240, partial [Candidatus Rokubacteria bacterium]|nr:hypothetical protein [Candidatus Rokubacteria bacterium]
MTARAARLAGGLAMIVIVLPTLASGQATPAPPTRVPPPAGTPVKPAPSPPARPSPPAVAPVPMPAVTVVAPNPSKLSCVTGGCHSEMGKARYVHGPVA